MKPRQRSNAIAALLFGAMSNAVIAAAASSGGAVASAMPSRPPEIQILEIDAPGLSTRQSAARQKQQEISKERASQQELARKRIEARVEAEQNDGKAALDPAVKFNRRIDSMERLLREEKFQRARSVFDQAMNEKPADLPIPDRVRSLEAQLNAQNTPVEVRLKSDGETYVSIASLMPPQKLYAARLQLLPGDYEVKGQRPRQSDVLIKLRVRNGEPPPPVISVVSK